MTKKHAVVSKNTPAQVSPTPAALWSLPGLKLFLLGFLTLFLELLFIRFLAGSIWNLGYFPNIVLLSAFIGMGLGFVFHHYLTPGASRVVFQAGFAVITALIAFVCLKHPIVPGFNPWHYNIDGDLYFSNVPFKAGRFNYLFFVLCFVMVIAAFGCISQRTAKLFRLFRPLDAYTLDILGSCAGILCFIGISALRLPAYWWFLLFTLLFPWTMPDRWKSRWIPLLLGCVAVGMMYQQDTILMSNPQSKYPLSVYWSPYQKVEFVEDLEPKDPSHIRSCFIFVNGLHHQAVLTNFKDQFYYIPYDSRKEEESLPKYKNVLIIGSGAGNDVAAALRHDVEHVDAVEIDPVIAMLGKTRNPLRPYDDPRVSLYIDDGRAFMTQTNQKYDLIIFALTDSLVKVSSLSQLRLENYLFTQESVARAYELLNENGDMVFYNFYRLPFVSDKIMEMVARVTHRAPAILAQSHDFYMVRGRKLATAPAAEPSYNRTIALPTDDWPFLYLEKRGVPELYLKAMGGLFIVITGLMVVLHLTTRNKEGYKKPGMLAVKVAFALMGIAFLLLETKSVIQFSLLFGTTWLNNSLIFLAVLISVLAANWTVQWVKKARHLWVFYILLVVSALSTYAYPLHHLLEVKSLLLRFVLASLLTFSPIYFANLIFSLVFKDQTLPEHIFGWNLLGATFGGILEYCSMAVGYNFLSIVVVACYTLVFVLVLKAQRQWQLAPEYDPTSP
jgi:hypothetical protein